jgi:hypothetical protein
MHKRDWIAWGSWVGIAFSMWVLAWIVSAAIPVFSNLLSLIVCFPLTEMCFPD